MVLLLGVVMSVWKYSNRLIGVIFNGGAKNQKMYDHVYNLGQCRVLILAV